MWKVWYYRSCGGCSSKNCLDAETCTGGVPPRQRTLTKKSPGFETEAVGVFGCRLGNAMASCKE